MCIDFRQIDRRFQLRSCTIVSNGLEARSTKSKFLVEQAGKPVHKRLIENGARSQFSTDFSYETGVLTPVGLVG
ncbi:MAG: hypothetical protein EAZ18_07080 [Oscillatoriales cyanobacterium]|nr:MAG: hypothetical protein EAZ18_07080 [Oscillatoriales cyanobacterium]